MISETNPAGVTISYDRDSSGYTRSVTSSWSDSTHPATLVTVDSNIGYWPTGALRLFTYANGLTEDTMYDARWRQCRINVNTWDGYLTNCSQDSSGRTIDFTITPAANGNITSFSAIGAQVFNRSYTYDAVDRLATMSAPGDQCTGLSWTYDAWGNRTDQTATGGTCNTFHQSVDFNNRLLGPTYQYDAAGNLTYDGSHNYYYDAENHLYQVDGSVGYCYTGSGTAATACYVYAIDGRRTAKITGSIETDFYYDSSGRMMATYGGGCGITCWNSGYVYLNGTLAAVYADSTTYFPITDYLDSTRLLTGYPTPTIAECDDYYPFGERIPCGANGVTPFEFTGYERDSETNLDDANARYFASAQGRFMSSDPAGDFVANPANPQSWNMYSYVVNSPLSLVDPTGMIDCSNSYISWGTSGHYSTIFGNALVATTYGMTNSLPCDWAWFDLQNLEALGKGLQPPEIGLRIGNLGVFDTPINLLPPPQKQACTDAPPNPLGASSTFNTGVVSMESKGMWPATKLAFFYDIFHTGGPYDYKTTYHNQQYVNYGNWNFGYVCGANYPALFCQSAAGTARMWSAAWQGQNPFGDGFPLLKSPYGDQAADNQQIRNGIAAQKSGCVQ